MDNPGCFTLGDFNITAAGTQTGVWTSDGVAGIDLSGIVALAVQARLQYGSGGGTCKVYIQTSFDQDATPVDIACLTFGAAGEVKACNIAQASANPADVTDGTLADNTVLPGLLGDRFRAKVVVAGTSYAGNTLLSVRGVAR
jgi:hypothetical protein